MPKSKKQTTRQSRPALSPEARENQCIALAMDLAEKKLRDGTASSQLITEFVKRGSTKSKLEQEILEEQKTLITAKTENLKAATKSEQEYSKVVAAIKKYSGYSDDEEDEEDEEDEYY